MPVRIATPEETQAIFGSGIVLPGRSRTRSSTEQTSAPKHSDKTPEGQAASTSMIRTIDEGKEG